MTPNLELAIAELCLTGFDPHGRGEMMEYVEAALTQRLAAEAGVWADAGDLVIDRIDLGRLAPGATRQATAERIAGQIHGALTAQRGARAGGAR